MINNKNKILIGPQFIILLGILLIGSILRLLLAYKMPFIGDECGTMINICYSPKYILTHFHCWLTMNWYILFIKMIAKVFGEGFIAIRFLSIISGVGTILLTGLISMRLFPKANWLLPAALVSLNPYLISYSAIARVYAVFTFCGLLLWLLFIIWRDNPSWGNSISLSLCSLFLILLNLNGIFILLWLSVIILIEILRNIYASERYNLLWLGIKRLGIPLAFCMISAGLFYYQLWGEIRLYSKEWIVNEVSSISYVPDAVTFYFGTKPVAGLFLFFMLIGVIQTFRWDRYKCLWLSLWIVLPIITAAILGYSFNFWDYARFFIFVLPGILIFSAIGIDTIVSLFGKRIYKFALPLVILFFFLAWIPEINKQFEQGNHFPFNKVFKYISEHARENDRIVSLEPYSYLHLSLYMSCDERAAVEHAIATREIFLHSTVPDLMKDTERGRVFLVSSDNNIPTFNLETIALGDIRVSILNPEGKAERYTRLLNGYEGAVKDLKKDAGTRGIFSIYGSLSDLAKFHGDSEKEKHYKSILESFFRKRLQKNKIKKFR